MELEITIPMLYENTSSHIYTQMENKKTKMYKSYKIIINITHRKQCKKAYLVTEAAFTIKRKES